MHAVVHLLVHTHHDTFYCYSNPTETTAAIFNTYTTAHKYADRIHCLILCKHFLFLWDTRLEEVVDRGISVSWLLPAFHLKLVLS